GSRARAAREGDQRRRRIPGVGEAQGRCARDRRSSGGAPAALPADAARAGLVAIDDHRLPGTDRSAEAVPREVTQADLRHDPWSGRWSAVAPRREARPGASHTTEQLCPFCAGSEHLTPPETLRLGNGPTGWDVRVVPNLYPALERQEVVVHGPEHVASLADVRDATLDAVAEAWRRRAREVGG